VINKKMYYSISEVGELTGLEQHVLRYWEAEIPKLRPKKNSAGNRAYREKDIELIRKIKHLLHDENLSVQEARQRLTEERKTVKQNTPPMQGQEPLESRTESTTPVQLAPSSNVLDDNPPTSALSGQYSLLTEIREGLEDVLALLT